MKYFLTIALISISSSVFAQIRIDSFLTSYHLDSLLVDVDTVYSNDGCLWKNVVMDDHMTSPKFTILIDSIMSIDTSFITFAAHSRGWYFSPVNGKVEFRLDTTSKFISTFYCRLAIYESAFDREITIYSSKVTIQEIDKVYFLSSNFMTFTTYSRSVIFNEATHCNFFTYDSNSISLNSPLPKLMSVSLSMEPDYFIYPNPTNTVITVRAVDKENSNTIFLVDPLGRMVDAPLFYSEKTARIDVGSVVPGLYFLKINNKIKAVIIE